LLLAEPKSTRAKQTILGTSGLFYTFYFLLCFFCILLDSTSLQEIKVALKSTLDRPSAIMPNLHPYYPLDANVVGYEPNQTPVLELLISAGGACTVLLGVTFALASYVRPTLHLADRLAILWFVLCETPVKRFAIEY
jgi:hypothetical protein